MEPQMENQVFEEKNISVLRQVTPLSKYLAMALFIIMPFIGGWIGYKYAPNLVSTPIEQNSNIQVPKSTTTEDTKLELDGVVSTEPQLFTSNIKNISFKVPSGWSHINRSEVLLPHGASEPWFLIKEASTGCLIASGAFEYQNAGYETNEKDAIYKQGPFADRVFSEVAQFDGSWYTFVSLPNQGSRPLGYMDDKNYSIRFSYNMGTGPFYLWQEQGASVPESCNTSLNEILQSSNFYYEPITLSNESDGMIWIKHERNNTYLLTTLPTGDTYKVLDLPSGVNWYGRVLVIKNKLFFTVNNYSEGVFSSKIISVDPYTKEIKVLFGTDSNESYISSLYSLNDNIYYLKGDSKYGICLDGYGGCEANLYLINLEKEEGSQLIAKNVLGGDIMGYFKNENSLYLSRRNGDGGCSFVMINKYDFSTHSELKVADASGCGDEPDYDKVGEVYKSANDKLELPIISKTIRLSEGSLLPSDLEKTDSYTEFHFSR